jgi:DNA-binding Lrp family transcriptional regulator
MAKAKVRTHATARKAMKAYVLIETAAGKTPAVKRALARIKAGPSTVVHLDGVTGPYDFIAIVEGPSLDAIGGLVTNEIGVVDGVTRTTTCLAVTIA